MKNKVSGCLIRGVIFALGILTIAVTLFLFIYIFWKGKTVMSLSFLLDRPAGVPLGTAGGIFPALMGTLFLGLLAACIGGILGLSAASWLVLGCPESLRSCLVWLDIRF